MKLPTSTTAKAKNLTTKTCGGGRNVKSAAQKQEASSMSPKAGSKTVESCRSPCGKASGRVQPESPSSPGSKGKVSKGIEKAAQSRPVEVPRIKGELQALRQKKSVQNHKSQSASYSQPGQVDPADTERSERPVASTASESSSIHSFRHRATSEPPLPRHLGHLGIPNKSPKASPQPQGRESQNLRVFEWEQAQSRRASLYSAIPDRGRSHQDSSAVNALVFGQHRTRPGSVDPGLTEERIRPGSLMEQPVAAGMPAFAGSREGVRRLQRSATPQPSNGVLMGHGTLRRSYSEKPRDSGRRGVPQISAGEAGLGEVVFGNEVTKAPSHPQVIRQVWGGCAGQPSTRTEGGRKAPPQFSTLWDLEGYAGLVSQSSCTLTSSLPGSPLSDTSSVVEPTRRSGIRLIQGASDSHYQIQEASPHWQLEPKVRGSQYEAGDPDEDRLSTYRSLYEGAAGRSSWTGSVSRRQRSLVGPEISPQGNASDLSNELQVSSPFPQESGSGSDRCRMKRQFPSKPATQASLIGLAHDDETGHKIREEREAWNKIFERSAGRLTHREERRGVKSVTSSVPSTKDLLTPSPEPLPTPKPRPTLEEGGGAPWDRCDSAKLNARGRHMEDSSSA